MSVDGVIVAHGSHAGGYALYLEDRRLHFTYNFLGTEITTVSAEVELPAGRSWRRVGRHPASAVGAGDVELFYGDVPVGAGTSRDHAAHLRDGRLHGRLPAGRLDRPALDGRAEITAGRPAHGGHRSRGSSPGAIPAEELRKDLATQ